MEHVTLKATTTEVDVELGTFTALVSAWDADREQDVIERDAFDKTTAAWRGSGRRIPLLFEHSTTVVGALDPATMTPTEAGLVIDGEVDRTEAEGRQVWRSIKANTAGFSIGFMSKSKPRKGGGRILTEVDLIEISVTAKPANAATRALSWKSASTALSGEELWLPRSGAQEKSAGTPSFETIVEDVERIAKASRPIHFETFEVG